MRTTTFDVVLPCLAILILIIVYTTRRRSQTKLPPGPKGYPLIGNLFDMPPDHKDWLTFAKWGETYGDICSITILGQPIVILNSAKIARDMLAKKSSIYSDRPTLQMGGELAGWKNTLVLLRYGDRWRRTRRFFQNNIGSTSAIQKFHPGKELEARKFVSRIISQPEELYHHVRFSIGAAIARDAYGYEVVNYDKDPFINLVGQAVDGFSQSTAPPGYLVDFIPPFKHIPDWMPGSKFKSDAAEWSRLLHEMVNRPFEFVKEQISTGAASVSFVSSMLEEKTLDPQEEFEMKWAAASLYSGAADTTVSAVYAFFLAMTLYPEAARKAQQEIDEVIGPDRLPTYADRQNLPYVQALIREVFRWNSVAPTAVPHRVLEDDIHEGYYIPAGTLVIANLWGMTHDPRVYPDPLAFKPDRHLKYNSHEPEPDPRDVCFGFGRRVCPGSHHADATVYITCVTALAVLNISKVVEDGVEIIPVHENTPGTISHPTPFMCSIRPCSEKALSLLQQD